MKRVRIQLLTVLCFAAAIGVARGSWYDDYAEGIKAARAGQWARVVASMTKAIQGNAKEANNARTYGAIFINYKPYYYRGVANLNLGKYEQAIADFEKTMGPGEIDLGPIEAHIKRAKDALAGETTTTVIVDPPEPPPPSIDPLLRRSAEAAVNQALDRLEAAQQRNAAGTTEYKDAMTQYRDASRRLNSVTSNDDLRTVIRVADGAVRLANLAIGPPPPPPPPTDTTKTAIVENDVLGPTRKNLRLALVSYFEGDFVAAETKFKGLSRDLPRNPWIWAFLGASQWSRYAFETEEELKVEAIRSFKKARQYGWKGGLPQKYFSRRIRNAFERTAG